MPSRREQITMSPQEVRAYLEAQRRIVLVTIGADGMPHAVPMNYGLDDAGRVLLTAFAKSQKVRNLERDPRATLLVESGATYGELKAVMLQCRVELVRDPDRMAGLMARLRADDMMATSISGPMEGQVRASLAKRVVMICTPQRTISWDHGLLGTFY